MVNNRESIRREAPFPRHKAGPHDFSTPVQHLRSRVTMGGWTALRCVPATSKHNDSRKLAARLPACLLWRPLTNPWIDFYFSLLSFFLEVEGKWKGRRINCKLIVSLKEYLFTRNKRGLNEFVRVNLRNKRNNPFDLELASIVLLGTLDIKVQKQFNIILLCISYNFSDWLTLSRI